MSTLHNQNKTDLVVISGSIIWHPDCGHFFSDDGFGEFQQVDVWTIFEHFGNFYDDQRSRREF